MSALEKNELLTLCRMVQHCHNKNNSPAVRQWAANCGKRALLAWSTIRCKVV